MNLAVSVQFHVFNFSRSYESFRSDLNCLPVVTFGDIRRVNNVAQISIGCDILIATVGRLCDYMTNEVVSFLLQMDLL